MRWRSSKEISGETGNFGTRLQCWRSLNGTHRVGLRERLTQSHRRHSHRRRSSRSSNNLSRTSRYQEASQTGEGAVFGFGCGGCEEWSTYPRPATGGSLRTAGCPNISTCSFQHPPAQKGASHLLPACQEALKVGGFCPRLAVGIPCMFKHVAAALNCCRQ